MLSALFFIDFNPRCFLVAGYMVVLPHEERYRLVGRLIGELKLRKYSFQTGKAYISVVKNFLKSGRTPRQFLLEKSGESRSSMRNTYFALKFYFEKVLGGALR